MWFLSPKGKFLHRSAEVGTSYLGKQFPSWNERISQEEAQVNNNFLENVYCRIYHYNVENIE